ncbi:MAG: hypothetical protein ACXVRS_12770 [Gaiellaceae bacterium]|jgi:hypothetical protein
MAKKQLDPLKAKQQKQKKILAVLGVVFLGVVAFMGPKLWKQLHPPPLPPRVIPANGGNPVAGAPTLAAPTLRGAEAPGATTTDASGSLVAATTTVQDGQLASFSRFASKDPFAQQLSDVQTSSSSSPSGGSSGGGSANPGLPGLPGSAPKPGTAVISVNGTLYTVATKTDFPQPSAADPTVVPLFHLVSVTAHTATISIAGGSYATGAPTVTLKENKPVTLMNTADGTRYTLVLKPLGTAVSTGTTNGSGNSGSGGTSTTPTSTTVTLPPPTP